jgi:SAM-dependent methyltransferase
MILDSFTCGICYSNNIANELFPSERMLGLRERFRYIRCADCGCLQLTNPPSEIARYYPIDYYAFQFNSDFCVDRFPFRRKFLYFPITAQRLGWSSRLGWILHKLGSGPVIPNCLRMIQRPLKRNSPILDVGCANGRMLFSFRACGFSNLLGVDPFMPDNMVSQKGISFLKQSVDDLPIKFDLIMLHHVFEHLANPIEMLKKFTELLSPNGQILIRIPLSDSIAALEYGVNWVQLDAPRHFFLHTRKSIKIATDMAGLQIANVQYDSEEFQFIGSEVYSRSEMSLNDFYEDYGLNYSKIFKPEESRAFRDRADFLNKIEKGDQAGFCLVKA